MISKPFNFAKAQEAYLRDKWDLEFYNAVDRLVKRPIPINYTLMEMQHYVIARREDYEKPSL